MVSTTEGAALGATRPGIRVARWAVCSTGSEYFRAVECRRRLWLGESDVDDGPATGELRTDSWWALQLAVLLDWCGDAGTDCDGVCPTDVEMDLRRLRNPFEGYNG